MAAVFDQACAAHIPVTSLLTHGMLPVRRTAAGVLIVTADPIPDEAVAAGWFPAERVLFDPQGRAATQAQILAARSDEVADEMANGFTRRHPDLAARTGIATWQRVAAAALPVGLLGAVGLGYRTAVLLLVAVVFVAAVLLRVLLAVAGAWLPAPVAVDLPDADLPTYTVLVPAYQEEAVIGETVRCIADLDYPADKLEVLVLLERRDRATADAVRAVDPPDFVRIVELPPGPPQTKPRSVNLGLLLAAGELLVIFDAEDRPERGQLRAVAGQFAAGGPRLACVQARLNFYNARRNLLTRLFSLEYGLLYDLVLPGLARFGLPIPLGGTSNHLRTEVLRAVGGWDAWNVTEDADLGMRLAAAGHRVAVSPATTWEECPAGCWPWMMQRTRWLKGFLLTLLVHTRRPWSTARRFGPAGLASLLVMIAGTPLTHLLWPVAAVLAISGGPAAVGAAAMVGAAGLAAALAGLAGYRRRLPWPAAVLLPAYWLLHGYAAVRAVVQLVRSPYSWEKTTHWTAATAPVTAAADPSVAASG